MDRKSNVSRTTSETDIQIEMNLDGKGKYNISTGVNFFNHMLEAFSKHSMIDLVVDAKGDIEIDDHFFESFVSSAKLNIYGVSKGANDHHQAEAVFKAFAKSLKEAIKIEHDEIPSTKGVL